MKRGSPSRVRQSAADAPAPRDAREDDHEAEESDGRRMRSSRSRETIIRAMIALIRDGDMAPSAARVAETAGVSLRTVFRHFEEMDSLNREMSAIIEAEVRPLLAKPLEARDWRGRLDELITRRTDIYERILPLKVAGSIRRFRSKFLMEDYQRFITLEREGLRNVLPQKIAGDRMLSAALEMATAFEAWRRLRQDQGLSAREAAAVMRLVIERLLDGL